MAETLNVLLVVIGGARADHASCYGYARETTPFLDQLAREGIRFSQAIANAAWTLSSHATLFTGLHAVTHGATEETRVLPERHPVLAEYLKAAGHRTAAFCASPWISPETGFGRGFDAFFTQRRASRLATRAILYGRRASDKLLRREDAGARRTNEALLQWLADGGEPFFAFVHYQEAHVPLHPPPPYDRLFAPAANATRDPVQDPYLRLAGADRWSEEDGVVLTALYDGALRYVDARLRQVAEALEARGAWDRTLVIVTGDHGENLGEHGMIGHAAGLHDTVLRVPLVLRCPPRVPQGFVAEELAQLTDIVPTVLCLLGIGDPPKAFHGRPLLDQGRATKGPSFTVSERFRPDLRVLRERLPRFDIRPFAVRSKAVRTLRQKFVWRSDEANELFDLVADPAETRNLVEEDTAQADALRQQLFDWLASVEKYDFQAHAGRIDKSPQPTVQEVVTSE